MQRSVEVGDANGKCIWRLPWTRAFNVYGRARMPSMRSFGRSPIGRHLLSVSSGKRNCPHGRLNTHLFLLFALAAEGHSHSKTKLTPIGLFTLACSTRQFGQKSESFYCKCTLPIEKRHLFYSNVTLLLYSPIASNICSSLRADTTKLPTLYQKPPFNFPIDF